MSAQPSIPAREQGEQSEENVITHPTDPTEGHSKRFEYFYKALKLASHKLSTKWTEEDFAQCFPTWAKESPQGVAQVRIQVGEHIRDQIVEQSTAVLNSYCAADGIDALAAVIADAKERVKEGNTDGLDVWKEGLTPKALVHARTGRVLREEKERLELLLKELDDENAQLFASLQEKQGARKELSKELDTYLNDLDEALDQANALPLDDVSEWMETVVDPVPMNDK
ncbi:hypothetical protein DACRYDRAFT_21924 [Dacryopinax primogenitus]|uniref:Nnf1-domain-containing protein n=1 Tax=Dacryopinax primogenitus (strain DJM 731) TaxID=1858805 RepID=M5FWB8_DACPD|nr:uncharacterized protein DACRYDRAFT_21924 [Dacryopinax primogenitus]EJU02181.1 hypothetical protein DACRYDRAFT_21924 [Dacryopinax primogenitus]